MKRVSNQRMRLFFATDIHGANRVFSKFLNSLKIYQADVGIVGGDVMGKRLVPIVENQDGSFEIEYFGRKQILQKDKAEVELPQMESALNDTGYYTVRCSPDEFAKMSSDPKYLDELFQKVMLERLDKWIEIAARKLEGTKTKVFMSGGNDDLPIIDQFLRRPGSLVYCESEVVKIDPDHEMISCGYANINPWKCPRDIPEEQLEEKLESMISRVRNVKNCVFNVHVPPINTSLDECPKLDTSVDPPKIIVGQVTAGGSTAVRNAIKKYQPLVALHGHIHESRGVEKLGRTVCINPGSEYTEGILRGVVINLDKEKVKSYQFTSG
jgi:uncharacterized protein